MNNYTDLILKVDIETMIDDLPSWITFSNGKFTFKPLSNNIGDYQIKVTVTDQSISEQVADKDKDKNTLKEEK